mgnify:CR=1 FL=1
MRQAMILSLFLLAACGADGAPERPGLNVSGEARAGVVTGN